METINCDIRKYVIDKYCNTPRDRYWEVLKELKLMFEVNELNETGPDENIKIKKTLSLFHNIYRNLLLFKTLFGIDLMNDDLN